MGELQSRIPVRDAADRLRKLPDAGRAPSEFWPELLRICVDVCGARFGLLCLEPVEGNVEWRTVGAVPPHAPAEARPLVDAAARLAAETGGAGRLLEACGPHSAIGLRLESGEGEPACVVLLLVSPSPGPEAEAALDRLELAAGAPRAYKLCREAEQARGERDRAAGALDLAAQVNARDRYLAAALTWCNALAGRFLCDRVSFGWQKPDGYLKVDAISNMEKFDRRMQAVVALETAMEECLDQDEELVVPQDSGERQVVRDHEAFARDQGGPYVMSVPLRLDGEPQGVVSLERAEGEFAESEVRAVRVAADLVAPRLADLQRRDRWFGARWAEGIRAAAGRVVGVRHTWARLLALAVLAGMLVLAFGHRMYRVEAPFVLRSDEVRFVHAPFDGYLEAVEAQVGDRVEGGALLVQFEVGDLRLEEAAASAEQTRYRREAEKYRATGALADMRVAEALAAQAAARLQQVRTRLAQSGVRAPFAAVVVEGDLQEKIGAPVRSGDPLVHLARLEGLHVRCEVDERDVHEIEVGQTGEVAFASRPGQRFPFTVTRIEPQGRPRPDGNVFEVHGQLAGETADWWRPGMSGVAKISIDRRNLFWIFTHRTTDWLRMQLWW